MREGAAFRVNTELFRTMLQKQRMSQRKFAQAMGLDPSAVSLMFRGKRKMQFREAGRAAEILGVHLNDLSIAAGVNSMSRQESGTILETLLRLLKHAQAHQRECASRGDMAGFDEVARDLSTAQTLISAMIPQPSAKKVS